ncbi:hypothetical protein AB0J74_26660 [Asanoa sp. NPDC049573]|uniref:hypothetical protein n=1 Tax=Asanoa sp. NPDC049573 TaxID=3155396 RepID=UPI003446F68E
MSEPEESHEKTSKTDAVLLKPILKDLNHLKDDEDLDPPTGRRRRPAGKPDGTDKNG